MRRALANRLGPPLGLEVQGILCYGKTGLFIRELHMQIPMHTGEFLLTTPEKRSHYSVRTLLENLEPKPEYRDLLSNCFPVISYGTEACHAT